MTRKGWLAPLVFVGALALYVRTLAPSVVFLFDDSLEFQLVGYRLAIAHPTGYPLYTLLLKLASFVPLGDVAYRANLLSALCAAFAVALVARIVLRLTDSIVAALASAVALAVSPIFWSQAVVAEVYALNALFVAAIGYWILEMGSWKLETGKRNFVALAFLLGLTLTHHRTIILLAPALAFWLWRVTSGKWHSIFNLQSAIFFLLPLSLYLYIPLRGAVGSLDGTYQNTLDGFVRWVTASNYNIFLSDNPFHENRDAAFFFNLFLDQFGGLGLMLGVVGLVWMVKRDWRLEIRDWRLEVGRGTWDVGRGTQKGFGIFCLVAFLTYLAFVLVYRVPDVEVFAIPAFLLMAVALGVGVRVALQLVARPRSRVAQFIAVLALSALLVWNFAVIFQASFAQNDLSRKTDVHDYGRDIIAQSFPPNATLVGILGEMTLVHYFQETEGAQPALVTIAADRDAARLNVIERELNAGRAVFTTRPLAGLPGKYSLDALGPLVRVKPAPSINALVSDAPPIATIRYSAEAITQPSARIVRAHIAWQPTVPITSDLKVSARLLDGEGLVSQKDDWPLHNAYHTTFWRAGELIHDAYDIPIPDGVPAKTYRVLLVVYRADSGAEVGRVEAGVIALR